MKKINFAVAAATTVAMLSAATPALAYNGGWGNNWNQNDSDTTITNTSSIVVSNNNTANVTNGTVAVSNTGANQAAGGAGQEGGNANASGDDANAEGGNGGNGGNAGVQTGVAVSSAGTMNMVNTNAVEVAVDDCGCAAGDLEDEGDTTISNTSNITVGNSNAGTVLNLTAAVSNTGLNGAQGGTAGEGGDATAESDEDNNGGWGWWHHGYNNNDDEGSANAEGGNGGVGGDAVVISGDAGSEAGTINVVNTNFVRVTKGLSL